MVDRQMRWDRDYLDLAEWWAEKKSKDPSTRIGAVIVRPSNSVASLGYNGFPKGVHDCGDQLRDRKQKYPRVVHAEANAILAAEGSVRGHTLYSTAHPCCSCAGIIIQAGIARVVTRTPAEIGGASWRDELWIAEDMFRQAGVELALYNEKGVLHV